MQKIIPNLWFDRNAEEAMNYYVSVFAGSSIKNIIRYPDDVQLGPQSGMRGLVLYGLFELAGQEYACIDGGPYFTFNEAISLSVSCKDQEEIDYYWSKLSAVPKSEQCGWCKDKFGLSWQIVPSNMLEVMQDKERGPQAMQHIMTMKKIIIAEL